MACNAGNGLQQKALRTRKYTGRAFAAGFFTCGLAKALHADPVGVLPFFSVSANVL